jgi:predicted GIY-YIG superfamily endonuclease
MLNKEFKKYNIDKDFCITNRDKNIYLCGIYAIINNINGKIYVGSTSSSFEKRWEMHLYELKYNKHNNRYLQSSISKYGIENFNLIIVETISEIGDDANIFLKRESHYINLYDSYSPNGYNIAKVHGIREKDVEEGKKIKARIEKKKKERKFIEDRKRKILRVCNECSYHIAPDGENFLHDECLCDVTMEYNLFHYLTRDDNFTCRWFNQRNYSDNTDYIIHNYHSDDEVIEMFLHGVDIGEYEALLIGGDEWC